MLAILIIKGKAYVSDCDHQACLEMYLKDMGAVSEFDWSLPGEETQKAAEKKTFALKETHEVYGFDVFDYGEDYVLLAHDKETLEKNYEWAKTYAKENEMKLAYFIRGYDAEFVD